ncbi:hypothetical protein N431DRAFT_560572 [Stipitochalara longipes BDJ]|nr:hypothetical protein N431DRAFT_560572 [Stipitochalara longipes BDJ]
MGTADSEMNSTPPETQSRESSAVFDPPMYEISYASDHTLQWNPPQGSKELAIALSYHFPLERDLESKMRAATKKFLKAEAKKKSPAWNSVVQKAKAVLVRAGGVRRSEKENSPALAFISDSQRRSLASVQEDGQVVEKDPIRERGFSPRKPPSARPRSSEHGDPTFSENASEARSSSRPLQILKWDPGVNRFAKRKKRRYGKEEGSKVAANRGNACADHQRKKMKCDPEICPQNKQNLTNGFFPHRDASLQESSLNPGGKSHEVSAVGSNLASELRGKPQDKKTKPSGVEHSLDAQVELESFAAHQSIISRGPEIDRTEDVISLQAATIPDYLGLPGLWSNSLEDWWKDPFSTAEVGHQAHAQSENALNAPTLERGALSAEHTFLSDPPYINHATEPVFSGPYWGWGQSLSNQVDQQYIPCHLDRPHQNTPHRDYSVDLGLNYRNPLSPALSSPYVSLHQRITSNQDGLTGASNEDEPSIHPNSITTAPMRTRSARTSSQSLREDRSDDSSFKRGQALEYPTLPGEEQRNDKLPDIMNRYNHTRNPERQASYLGPPSPADNSTDSINSEVGSHRQARVSVARTFSRRATLEVPIVSRRLRVEPLERTTGEICSRDVQNTPPDIARLTSELSSYSLN